MHDTTAVAGQGATAAAKKTAGGQVMSARFARLQRRFPTVAHLRDHARRHVPHFAFEYMDGGAGSDGGIARNWRALDAVELVPRYGVTSGLPPIETEIFGRRYAAPFGIAPMGGPSIAWPGADQYLAQSAQAARVPYVLSTVGGISIERAAELAPDVFWFQLYRFAKDDHKVGFDLVRRADAAGAHALVLTLDVPVRTTRSREVAGGIVYPFRITPSMAAGVATSPGYMKALLTYGITRFTCLTPYCGNDTSINAMAAFMQGEQRGAFTWEEVARFRDRWKRPLVLKGILHPSDAEKALALGADGIVVSNHGGRQVEGLPAAVDALPAIAAAVGKRAAVMMDSGVRSGLDVVRALALGADAAFAGKAFLWGVGALGADGPGHVIDIMVDETRSALGQIGAKTIADARHVLVRHPGALDFRTNT
jgi:isopentenyl diphosphate isomerase/L-lactate dehydrogenase-like FMN-dependent dehydrogenase